MDAVELLQEITDYCRSAGMAESTFGKLAVNDGKFVNRLRDGIARALAQPAVIKRMQEQGLDVIGSGPTDFDTKIRGDIDKWRRVFKEADIHVE